MGLYIGNFDSNILPESIIKAFNEDIPCYGVKFDGTNSAGVRTYQAAELQWTLSTNTIAGTDDFKDLAPFNVKECITQYNSSTGKREVLAYKGDANWDSLVAAKTGDRMIEFPKFWYKRPSKYEWIIAPEYKEGFKPSPMHYRNGVLYDTVRVSKYALNTNYVSQTGFSPRVSTNMNTFRTNIRNKGQYLLDYPTWCSIVMLMMVKYANMNVQNTVGYGRAGGNATIVSGYTDSILGIDGTVSALNVNESVLTFGIENFYSNVWKYVDGFFTYQYAIYMKDLESMTADPISAAELTNDYIKLTTGTCGGSNSAIKDIVYSEDIDYAMYPIATGSPCPTGDAMWSAAGLDCLLIGGSAWNGASDGPFCFYVNAAVGCSDITVGALSVEFP